MTLFLSAETRSFGWPWTQAPTTTRSLLDASAAWGKGPARKNGWRKKFRKYSEIT